MIAQRLIKILFCSLCFTNLYAEDSKLIRIENNELGTYLKIEFLREDLVRFEAGKKDLEPSGLIKKIWESPMILKQKWNHPPIRFADAYVFETSKLKVQANPNNLCATVSDKILGKDLGQWDALHDWRE